MDGRSETERMKQGKTRVELRKEERKRFEVHEGGYAEGDEGEEHQENNTPKDKVSKRKEGRGM